MRGKRSDPRDPGCSDRRLSRDALQNQTGTKADSPRARILPFQPQAHMHLPNCLPTPASSCRTGYPPAFGRRPALSSPSCLRGFARRELASGRRAIWTGSRQHIIGYGYAAFGAGKNLYLPMREGIVAAAESARRLQSSKAFRDGKERKKVYVRGKDASGVEEVADGLHDDDALVALAVSEVRSLHQAETVLS